MKGYKAFEKGECVEGAELKNADFYTSPFDVLEQFPFIKLNGEIVEYAEVEADGVHEKKYGDLCAKKMKVVSNLGIAGLAKAFANYRKEKAINIASDNRQCSVISTVPDIGASAAYNAGSRSVAAASGTNCVAVNSGRRSTAIVTSSSCAAINSGAASVAINLAGRSIAVNSGDDSMAICSEGYSAAAASGKSSIVVNSGGEAVAFGSGDLSVVLTSGLRSAASAEGKESFAIATGLCGRARGNLGCYIACAEWGRDRNGNDVILDFKTHKVDGETIKEGVFYTLKNGEFVEAEQ